MAVLYGMKIIQFREKDFISENPAYIVCLGENFQFGNSICAIKDRNYLA